MATAVRTTPTTRVQTDPTRSTARIAGWLYLVTIVASIPAFAFFYAPVLTDPGYIVGAGADTRVLVGGFLEVITALACIGTAVVLFPVIRRQNEVAALGFVAARVVEAAIIAVGIVSVLTVVSLRQDLSAGADGAGGAAGADADVLVTVGASLVATHDWAQLIGPGVLPAVNALLLATVVYRARLVPRAIPLMGLVGAPVLLLSATATLFGVIDAVSPWAALAAAPIALWELSFGVYLVVKGFTPSPLTAGFAAARASMPTDDAVASVLSRRRDV